MDIEASSYEKTELAIMTQQSINYCKHCLFSYGQFLNVIS